MTSDAPPVTDRPQAPVGLYLHVPFCVSLCPYCDFPVVTGRATRGPTSRIPTFLAALHAELDLRADAVDDAHGPVGMTATAASSAAASSTATSGVTTSGHGPGTTASPRSPLETVYLGGGTPSLLGPDAIAGLLRHVERRFGIAPDAEITLEANPGPGERGDLAGYRAAGVTRLSLGAQSLVPAELRALGRRHQPGDVMAAVHEARAAGFASVSLDLLTDIPGQTTETWRSTLDAVVASGPDHVSAYALTLEDPDADGLTGAGGDHLPVRPGARRWRQRARRAQDQDRAAEMDTITGDILAAAGIVRYELSNHARAGHASRHNRGYWLRRPIAAVGPGAHAFDGAATRSWNAARLDGWLTALLPSDGAPSQLPPGGATVLDAADAVSEAAILGLRLTDGIDGAATRDPALGPGLAWAVEHGLVHPGGDGRLRLTPRGRLLSNEVFLRLLP